MTSYLQVENLTKSYGDRVLFGDITFGVYEGDKIGIIAKNGTGKTTLMRVLLSLEDYDRGNIVYHNDLRIGYLEQTPSFPDHLTVLEACLYSDDPASVTLRKYESALAKGDDISDLVHEMDSLNVWDYEERFKQMLSQARIYDYSQPVSQLSGGQLKRLAIARLLINEPDLIFLDEPTNHLDIEMIEWLENYLSRSKATLLMVTHDRYFLDNVCNKILEIADHQIYTYKGNYNYYLQKHAERLDAQNAEVTKANNLLRRELDWMRRQPQARAHKAKYRIDAFYDLKKTASKRFDESNVRLDMKSSYIGSKIFEAEHVYKRFGDKIILDDFNYIFSRYEKLGIVGDNGVGKSTFIKLLQGLIPTDSGIFDIGETVRFGYYGQENITFKEDKKVIDAVREIAEVIYFDEKTSYTASQFLSQFLFSPTDQQKFIFKLSGGEKRRLYLATVLMRKPNFLILDEPTNDLDIVTLEILEEYIQTFKGCVIIVSHDRFFMDRCVDHIFVLEGSGVVKDFPGNYSEFRAWKKEQEKEQIAQIKAKEASAKTPQKRQYANKLTFKEKKELESLTAEIDTLEKEKSELERILNGESSESDINFDEVAKRFSEIADLLDEKEMRWLELSEKE